MTLCCSSACATEPRLTSPTLARANVHWLNFISQFLLRFFCRCLRICTGDVQMDYPYCPRTKYGALPRIYRMSPLEINTFLGVFPEVRRSGNGLEFAL